ncbi:hypothetical protein EHQ43_09940 [Leptospira bouyouniensis]|uniref:Uncharacterized protein n=1 Tax=Leptospira bouyouniensis TaxID=2484911 RepID=A0A7I0HT42_9LEPT|nr:hypothetical protein [Leptospira bouyouniensis]TGL06708.1 hypothetical protein EHQ43_09940 [Leptospira bouyouniensis]
MSKLISCRWIKNQLLFPKNSRRISPVEFVSLSKKSAGILISIDLKNSSKIKFQNIIDAGKRELYTQAFYQQHTKVYFQFIESLCKTNKKYIDQVFLIKNIGDEYWIIVILPENDNKFLKELSIALHDVIHFKPKFKLEELITLNYRVYAEYYPTILTFQNVWSLKYSEFIQGFFENEKLDQVELTNHIEKYSQTIGNFQVERKSPIEWDATVRYDPFGT